MMSTEIHTKFAALAIALMVNSTLIGGIAYLFDGQLHHVAPAALVYTRLVAVTGKVA